MNWIGRTSPDEVTVDLNSGLTSIFTTVTSGVSLRVAKMDTRTMANMRTPTTLPIMIFFLRLKAMINETSQNWN